MADLISTNEPIINKNNDVNSSTSQDEPTSEIPEDKSNEITHSNKILGFIKQSRVCSDSEIEFLEKHISKYDNFYSKKRGMTTKWGIPYINGLSAHDQFIAKLLWHKGIIDFDYDEKFGMKIIKLRNFQDNFMFSIYSFYFNLRYKQSKNSKKS